jgi:hypothetical protein
VAKYFMEYSEISNRKISDGLENEFYGHFWH